MSRKIKLHSLHFLFQIFSFLADKSGGWKLFVKPKLIIGSLLLSVTAYGQNATNNNKQKQEIYTKIDTTSILDGIVICYDVYDPKKVKSIIYEVVEQMPLFPGGDEELFKFINNSIKYVDGGELCYVGIQGRVICRFVVEKDGSIGQIEVIRGLESLLDKEAIRVIRSMPKWIPGKQNGVNVSVWYTLPINFKFQ